MGGFETKKPEDFNFKNILYEKRDWVARLTINRPEAHNALNTETLIEMVDALEDASWDEGVAVIVVTGAGDKAFCTGGDVKEYAEVICRQPRFYWKSIAKFIRAIELMQNCGKVTVARLNGMVVGGGNEFNLACDLAIAADDIKIKQVGTSVGSVAAAGATQWLPITVGDRRAREILFLNEWIDAKKALEWGLVNKVVPRSELDIAVDEMCAKLIEKFPECTRYTKQQLNFWRDISWHSTITHAREWLTLHYAWIEPYEGMNAFLEKRPTEYLRLRKLAAQGRSSEFLWGPYVHTCPECGAKGIPEEFKFCGACGGELK